MKRPGTRIRVLLIDAQGIVRDALCALLQLSQEFEVVGTEASPVEALYRSPESGAPDIILGDFPEMSRGEEVLAGLKARFPNTRAVVLTASKDEQAIEAALRAGAAGYVLKSDSCNELFAALRSVAAGTRFLTASVRDAVTSGPLRSDKRMHLPSAPVTTLTDREREVIRLIAAGHRTREIAKLLSLSHKTIEKHRTSLMRKLGLRNASAVTAYAIANGLG
jgi:DNA-binding NarL/FixJ family response regulator